jgi:hypothetical protein
LFLITNFSIRQTITNDGLVGINETTPTAQLQVKSAATNRVPLIVDTLASHATITYKSGVLTELQIQELQAVVIFLVLVY